MAPKRTARRPSRPSPPQPREGFVAVGWLRTPRGVRGELKIDPLTDFPERFAPGARLWAGGSPYTVRHARHHRGALLLRLEAIETREQAESLRGQLLEVPEEELALLGESQYFRFQVIGMEVVDQDGRPLGRVEQVLETGANDVYVVRSGEGELLIPAIDTVVKEVDVPGRRMTVELMEGLERRPNRQPRRR